MKYLASTRGKLRTVTRLLVHIEYLTPFHHGSDRQETLLREPLWTLDHPMRGQELERREEHR